MKKKSKRETLFFLLIGCAAVVAGIWKLRTQDLPSDNQGLSTGKVVSRDFTSTVLAIGEIKAQVGAEVRVGSRVSGRVERLYANIGDIVKKGQIVAELEKADLEAIVAQYQAELQISQAKVSAIKVLHPQEIEKAEADIAKWQASADLSGKELLREDKLLKQEFISQQTLDRTQERLLVAKAELVAAQKTLELLKAQFSEDLKRANAEIDRAKAILAREKTNLSFATITAPISGVIASVSTQEGETVAAGLNAPTFVTIINLFEGKVAAIYPKALIQDNVVYYDVVIKIISDYKDILRPEMTTSVTIFLDRRSNVLAVPAKAIKRERGKNVVYILSNGEPKPCEVKIGWEDIQWIEVIGDLEEGQTIFLDLPHDNLK